MAWCWRIDLIRMSSLGHIRESIAVLSFHHDLVRGLGALRSLESKA